MKYLIAVKIENETEMYEFEKLEDREKFIEEINFFTKEYITGEY